MAHLKKYSLLILFTSFIAIFTLLDILSPTKAFSDLENRSLALKPEFAFSKFLDGKYSSQYEKYINDQFLGRNTWISLKSRGEYALGKIENNGIIYGNDGYMFDKLQTLNQKTITTNIESIKYFIERYNENMTFILIPNSYAVLSDKVPAGAYLLDQSTLINDLYNLMPKQITTLDLFTPLLEHKEEYIYYRTDHHWTTYGAYLAYSSWVKSLGMEPIDLDSLQPTYVSDFYGTYFSKTKAFNAISDTITYYPISATLTIDGKEHTGFYDMDKWKVRDKYAGFLWGNNGVTVIKSNNNRYTVPGKTSKILLFKDSFANSLVPFLTYNFDEIHVIDLRALPMKLSDYMANHEFDQILMLYNVTNFIQDTNIARLKQ